MKNISRLKDCYGCGVCATACSQGIIEIRLNENGFYEPKITDIDKCTGCGLCVDACAYCHNHLSSEAKPIGTYAAWSTDDVVRSRCTSGGVAFELGRSLIDRDYKVCAVKYDADSNRAAHYMANSVNELIASIGSKYIQSYTVDAFKQIDSNSNYLVTGTPCQIDSLRRHLRHLKIEDHFILLDCFCHGVPSMLLWHKYLQWAEQKVGKIRNVSWRNKFTGWHDSWVMAIDGDNADNQPAATSYDDMMKVRYGQLNSWSSKGDMFFLMFLSDTCLGKQCYSSCKYKYDKSAADIRIGDLWGRTFRANNEGVNALLTFTQKGENAIRAIQSLHIEPHPIEVVAEYQQKRAPQVPPISPAVFAALKEDGTSLQQICGIVKPYMRRKRLSRILRHPLRALRNRLDKYLCK